jgi:hypothetical protein
VGGTMENTNNVELYSPNGKCQHLLAPIPTGQDFVLWPVLGILNGFIVACDYIELEKGDQNCWTYHISNNSWSLLTTSSYKNYTNGVVYDEKIYSLHYVTPEVYDPESDTWSEWPAPPETDDMELGCLFVWKKYLVLISPGIEAIQMYDVETSKWSVNGNQSELFIPFIPGKNIFQTFIINIS